MKWDRKSRWGAFRAAFLSLTTFFVLLAGFLVVYPDTPLPNAWNPIRPLSLQDEKTPLTRWKLRRAVSDRGACFAALGTGADFGTEVAYTTNNAQCFITAPVALRRVGEARMSGVRTDCPTALRLALWERHTVQPRAQDRLGTSVSVIDDIGSYNCRMMRTANGSTGRFSSHATASAIDISGFRFADGRSARLTADWDGSDAMSAFLRDVRDGACDWFPLTLSPDYNALHADHFHLQATGWGLCR